MLNYHPYERLKNTQTLLIKNGTLYCESINARKKRFTLINLFTNSRYDKSKVIAKLIEKAYNFQVKRPLSKLYLDDADVLLARAKAEAPMISKHRFIRWLKGTPLINIRSLEARIAQARIDCLPDLPTIKQQQPKPRLLQPVQPIRFRYNYKPFIPQVNKRPPVAPKNPIPPAKPNKPDEALKVQEARQKMLASLTLTQQEVVDILEQARKVCTATNFKHYEMLSKWIILAKTRDDVKNEYDRQKAVLHNGIGFLYMHVPANLYFHGERGWNKSEKEQDPFISLCKGLEDYVKIYQKIQSTPKLLESFFKRTFRGFNACFEGNHSEVTEWAEQQFNKNADLVLDIDSKKDKYQNIGQLELVFNAHVFREFYKNEYYYDYDGSSEKAQNVRKQFFNIGNRTEQMKKFRDENTTKERFMTFIRNGKYLPLQFSDITLTEENLIEQIDDYYAVVFGE